MTARFALRNCILALALVLPGLALGEIRAMFNYETKSPDSMKALKNPVSTGPRREGIAIIDVDPESKGFGKILQVVAEASPIRRNVTIEDVGNVAAFLLSDLAAGVTAEIAYVDAGFSQVMAGGRGD